MRYLSLLFVIILAFCGCNEESKAYRIVSEIPTEVGKNQILVYAVLTAPANADQLKDYVDDLYLKASKHTFSNGDGPALVGVYLYENELKFNSDKVNFEIMKFKGPLDATPDVSFGPTSPHNH